MPTVAALLAVLYGVWQWVRSRQRVFLLDFACYKPPENLKVSLDDFMLGSRETKVGQCQTQIKGCTFVLPHCVCASKPARPTLPSYKLHAYMPLLRCASIAYCDNYCCTQ